MAWSSGHPPKQAVDDFSPLVLASDAAGNATVVGATNYKQNVTVVEGSIVTNTWGSEENLQVGGYFVGQQRLRVAPNGRAVTIWLNGDPFGIYGSVRESVDGSWSERKFLMQGT